MPGYAAGFNFPSPASLPSLSDFFYNRRPQPAQVPGKEIAEKVSSFANGLYSVMICHFDETPVSQNLRPNSPHPFAAPRLAARFFFFLGALGKYFFSWSSAFIHRSPSGLTSVLL